MTESARLCIIYFESPSFDIPLDEMGMEFGDGSDEHITAQDVADLIRSQYRSLSEFASDFCVNEATVSIQLTGVNGAPPTHAEVEFS